jgi:hypothetical protein
MEKMTEQEFNERLELLVRDFNDKVVTLVHECQDRDGKDWQTDKPISWVGINYDIDRSIDNIITIGGWVYDRLHGNTRLSGRSLTKKLRKVLGYSYP